MESLKAPNPAKKGDIWADYNQLDSFLKRLVNQITYQVLHEARFPAFSTGTERRKFEQTE